MVQQHSLLGSRLIETLDLDPLIPRIILNHHENFDGTGYPNGTKGKDIPLEARIVRITDSYDALTSNRGYRPAYTNTRRFELWSETSVSLIRSSWKFSSRWSDTSSESEVHYIISLQHYSYAASGGGEAALSKNLSTGLTQLNGRRNVVHLFLIQSKHHNSIRIINEPKKRFEEN